MGSGEIITKEKAFEILVEQKAKIDDDNSGKNYYVYRLGDKRVLVNDSDVYYLHANFSIDIVKKGITNREYITEGLNIYENKVYEYSDDLKEELATALNIDYELLNNTEESLFLIDDAIEKKHDIGEFASKYFLNILVYVNQCIVIKNEDGKLVVINDTLKNIFWEPCVDVKGEVFNTIPWLIGNIYDNEYNISPLLPTFNTLNNIIRGKGVLGQTCI